MILLLTGTEITFWICAAAAIAGAIGLVAFKKPVYSALCLALVMVSLAVIYASQNAPFLFAVQIIVYTGAVLMLFLFVIMLIGVNASDSLADGIKAHRAASITVGVGVLALLVLAVGQAMHTPQIGVGDANDDAGGNVQGLASIIFSKYVIAFEATAALLITAVVAAMVLAHPERLKAKLTQSEQARSRLEAYAQSGVHPGPRPSSGVFARHNSIDTPALLPDGSIAEESVSKTLAMRVTVSTPDELWEPHDRTLDAIEDVDAFSELGPEQEGDDDE